MRKDNITAPSAPQGSPGPGANFRPRKRVHDRKAIAPNDRLRLERVVRSLEEAGTELTVANIRAELRRICAFTLHADAIQHFLRERERAA